MLSLQLKSGEYITIGEEVVVQVFQQPGSSFRVEVQAPREVPILRGAVREREGKAPPEALFPYQPVKPARRAQSQRRQEALDQRRAREAAAIAQMRQALDQLEQCGQGGAPLRDLREGLDRLSGREIP